MAKTKLNAEVSETETTLVASKPESIKAEVKATKKPKAKEKRKSKVASMLKETGSELKKVTWPTFGKVVKQTGVVIAVVIFFAAVLLVIDLLLGELLKLLV